MTPGLFGRLWIPRDVHALLYRNKWTEPLNMVRMVATVAAESSLYEGAVGTPNEDGTQDLGLFQINSSHWKDFGFASEADYAAACLSAERAAPLARRLFDEDRKRGGSGFTPWVAYGKPRWFDALPQASRGLCNFAAVELIGVPVV